MKFCVYCNNPFIKKYKESIKQYSNKKFCSAKCKTDNNIGKKLLITEARIAYWKSMKGVPGNSKKHGMSRTHFNGIWRKMKDRCYCSNNPAYKYYGGRGIKIEWNSFEEFKNDMFELYVEHINTFGGGHNTSIERVDNNGNYCKENCKWATSKEQSNNRRNNIIVNIIIN